jgi:hypothetical protein
MEKRLDCELDGVRRVVVVKVTGDDGGFDGW